jgi:hypothetical protein
MVLLDRGNHRFGRDKMATDDAILILNQTMGRIFGLGNNCETINSLNSNFFTFIENFLIRSD